MRPRPLKRVFLRLLALAALPVAILAGVYLWSDFADARQRLVGRLRRQAEACAAPLRRSADRVVTAGRLSAALMAQAGGRDRAASAGAAPAGALLREALALEPDLEWIALLGPGGEVLASAAGTAPFHPGGAGQGRTPAVRAPLGERRPAAARLAARTWAGGGRPAITFVAPVEQPGGRPGVTVAALLRVSGCPAVPAGWRLRILGLHGRPVHDPAPGWGPPPTPLAAWSLPAPGVRQVALPEGSGAPRTPAEADPSRLSVTAPVPALGLQVEVSASRAAFVRRYLLEQTPELAVLLLGGGATLALALSGARRLGSSLARLAAAAEAISRREFRLQPLPAGPVEEIVRLSRAIAGMGERVEASLAAAEAAREEADRERRVLEAVIEAMPIGVSIVEGPVPKVRRRNRAGDSIMGGSVPPGTPVADIAAQLPILDRDGRPIPPEQWPVCRALAGESFRDLEARLPDGQGGTRLIRIHVTPIPTGPGEPPHVLVLYEDVTEPAALRNRLTHAERLASLGTLVAGLAHELNNPLTGIIGFGELLLTRPLPEEARGQVALIVSEATRASRIVRNLLTFARPHSGERSLVDLAVVVERTLELRAHELRSRAIDVSVRTFGSPPPVRADQQQLQQVLLNLLLNAEHALSADPGRQPARIWITLREVGRAVRIEVEDNGPGIPAENLSRIFDPFFTTKPPGIGTGLGLSVSHGIVDAHGGRIWAESRHGGGARLIVELPGAEAAPETGSRPDPGAAAARGRPVSGAPTSPSQPREPSSRP